MDIPSIRDDFDFEIGVIFWWSRDKLEVSGAHFIFSGQHLFSYFVQNLHLQNAKNSIN